MVGAVAVVPYRVEQRSMAGTLAPGDLVLVDKLLPRIGGYARGDIVIFEAPGTWGDELHVLKAVFRWRRILVWGHHDAKFHTADTASITNVDSSHLTWWRRRWER